MGGWRWQGGGKNSEACALSSTFAYFLSSFVVLGAFGSLYGRYMVTPNVRQGIAAIGCLDDSEGSWALGVFYGDSPFSLRPIESVSFSLSSQFTYVYISVCMFVEREAFFLDPGFSAFVAILISGVIFGIKWV